MSTLTTANSSFALAVLKLFPVPQKLEGYAADDAFANDTQNIGEVVMGVDGKLSAGYIFEPVRQTITIMPTSPSLALFETWVNTEKATKEKFEANAVIMLPAIGRKYVLTRGYLTSAKPIPDAKKLLQALPFVITWQQVVGESL